jgi:hypothetical protein
MDCVSRGPRADSVGRAPPLLARHTVVGQPIIIGPYRLRHRRSSSITAGIRHGRADLAAAAVAAPAAHRPSDGHSPDDFRRANVAQIFHLILDSQLDHKTVKRTGNQHIRSGLASPLRLHTHCVDRFPANSIKQPTSSRLVTIINFQYCLYGARLYPRTRTRPASHLATLPTLSIEARSAPKHRIICLGRRLRRAQHRKARSCVRCAISSACLTSNFGPRAPSFCAPASHKPPLPPPPPSLPPDLVAGRWPRSTAPHRAIKLSSKQLAKQANGAFMAKQQQM